MRRSSIGQRWDMIDEEKDRFVQERIPKLLVHDTSSVAFDLSEPSKIHSVVFFPPAGLTNRLMLPKTIDPCPAQS